MKRSWQESVRIPLRRRMVFLGIAQFYAQSPRLVMLCSFPKSIVPGGCSSRRHGYSGALSCSWEGHALGELH